MKRLLAIPTLLLPICLFAQGFGSFSGDQPFLAGGSASGSQPPACDAAEWNPGLNVYTYALYDFNCLNQSAGTPITTMSDLGTNGLTLTPLYTTNYPYCTNNSLEINNRRYGFFDGINDNLQNGTSLEWPAATTVFLVASTAAPTNASGEVIFDNGFNLITPGGMDQLLFTHSTGEYLATFAGQIGPFKISTNIWVVTECRFNGASSYVKTNGVTAISGILNTTTRRVGVTLGSNRGQSLDNANAHVKIAWAGFYTNALDVTTTSNIFYYLTNRFDIHN